MRLGQPSTKNGFTLLELIVIIAIIGLMVMATIPTVSRINDSSNRAKNMANANHLVKLSTALASLGVAHVIPDSMGGVEATARLIRAGVTVQNGPMAGEVFRMAGLRDEDIAALNNYLEVQYGSRELSLVLKENPFLNEG